MKREPIADNMGHDCNYAIADFVYNSVRMEDGSCFDRLVAKTPSSQIKVAVSAYRQLLAKSFS